MINEVTPQSLPVLDSEYSLSQAHIDHFREKGYARVDGLLSPEEVAVYRGVILEAAMKHNRETRPLEERDTYGKAFLQVMNLWTVEEQVKQYVLSRRFAKVAADLLGVPSVRLYHDQALFKEPGGGHTPWHQDQFYWPLDTSRSVTLWMPMVEITPDMGSMTFAEGSHLEGFIELSHQISDVSEAFFDGYVRGKGYKLSGGGPMQAGDATFHTGWTLHKAPGNPTHRTREVMTVIYYPSDAKVKEPTNDFQIADLKTWLNGLPVGAPAAGPLNPVVYP